MCVGISYASETLECIRLRIGKNTLLLCFRDDFLQSYTLHFFPTQHIKPTCHLPLDTRQRQQHCCQIQAVNVGKTHFIERVHRLFPLEKHTLFRRLDRFQKMPQTTGSTLTTGCFVSLKPSNQFRNIHLGFHHASFTGERTAPQTGVISCKARGLSRRALRADAESPPSLARFDPGFGLRRTTSPSWVTRA